MTLSLVMPAYNEGEHIEVCVREWYDAVVSKLPDTELIVVDDRSKDNTWAILQSLRAQLPQLRPLQTPVNGGHGKAVRFGLLSAQGDLVFQTDSDRQHDPEDFWRLWAHRDEADFVMGVREQRADGPVRVVVTSVMRLLNFAVWQVWIKDANCPFKLMRREPMRRVLSKIPEDSFIPMVMLSILARRQRFRVVEEYVRHRPRTAGEQSLKGVVKWVKVGAKCASQLIRLRATV